jgi:hypothetical protein
VQQQGGSILSRVDGDVTVLHLTEVEKREGDIMERDYSRAQEQFRNISEVEAFRANYGSEKSFRADYASAIRQALAILARIQAEQREFILKQRSAYLWKPHADAITFLINNSHRLQAQFGTLLGMAEHRGLIDKATALNATLQKLHLQVQTAAKALQDAGN